VIKVTAKEYLSRAKDISDKIRAREAMIAAGYLSSEYKGINYDSVGSYGSGGNSTENAIIKAMDLDERISDEIAQLRAQLDEIRATILAVGNGTQERILALKFIQGREFEDIALEMRYSTRQVIRIYNMALEKVSQILKDVTQCH
jgi:hypothetical protein